MPVLVPGLGNKSFVQVGLELTPNVPVAATTRYELISCDMAPVIGVIEDQSLYNGVSQRAFYQGGQLFKGKLVMRCNLDGYLELYRGSFGGYTRTVVGGETIVFDSVFKEAQSLNSYTFEISKGDMPTGKCEQYAGCKISTLMIKGTAGTGNDAMLTVEVGILGRSVSLSATPTGSLTAPALFPVLYHQGITMDDATADGGPVTISVASVTISTGTTATRGAGSYITDGVRAGMLVSGAGCPYGTTVLTVNSATVVTLSQACTNATITMTFNSIVRLRSFEVNLDNKLLEDRYFLSALNPDEPLRGDFLDVTWKLTQEFNSIQAYTQAKAFTAGSPQLIFQLPGTIGVGSKREFELRSGSVNCTDFGNPVQGYGVIIATSTWRAFQDATDLSALVARVRNLEAALP